MGIYNLDRIFSPKSIAVFGASERQGAIGTAVMNNLIRDNGYAGTVIPINGRYRKVAGLDCFASLDDLQQTVDLAVIATPIATVPDIVQSCSQKGLAGAVIISSGGKEIGATGRGMEQRIHAAAGENLRLIGPNCVGIFSAKCGMNASFAAHTPIDGGLAFISQSGAVCTAVLARSLRERIGLRYFVSLGSMLDVDFGDLIDYFGTDPKVSSIIMYAESISSVRKFMSAARSVARVKPIIVFKSGKTAAGAAAAVSHTGAMTGEDAVYDAAFDRAGIIRVHTFEEMFDCAEFLSRQARPQGQKLGVITNAGGPGVMAVDALSQLGGELADLSPSTIAKLNNLLPGHWSHRNPVDILGDAGPARFREAAEILIDSKEIDGLLVIYAPVAMSASQAVAAELAGLVVRRSFPTVASWVGGVDIPTDRAVLTDAGIACFDTPERAVRAFMNLCRYTKKIKMLGEIPDRCHRKIVFDRAAATAIVKNGLEQKPALLTETESKQLLSAYGINVNRTETAGSATEAVAIAESLKWPVVMKIISRDISHKSDVNGVRIGLDGPEAVRNAYTSLIDDAKQNCPTARIDGIAVQEMIPKGAYELIVGAKQDADFGPVILFGLGGILTEIVKDTAIGLPPLNRQLAHRLIERTRVFRLLRGYRNVPPVNMDGITELLVRFSQLLTDFPEIVELDMNPVLFTDGVPVAVDARVLLAQSARSAPLHLVISPYPEDQESAAVDKDGNAFFIRPIRPEDASLLVDHFRTLSPRSVYLRFFTPVKELSAMMLRRLTQIDYDREIALVAMQETTVGEQMLGVSRVINEPGGTSAEFAVAIGDPWQGKGIGAALLTRCLKIATERGLKTVHGTVLSENTQMLKLGKKLGFKILSQEGGEYDLTIDIKKGA